ncbi:MAG: ABC transporter ATP-binding protein [Acidimicrobiales bacterium]
MSELLSVRDLHVSYGPVPVVRGVDLDVHEGEMVAIVGRNGAGKTTTLRCLAGLLAPLSGSIHFGGRDVTGLGCEQRVRIGISLSPEGRGIPPGLTVRENLAVGAFTRKLGRQEIDAEIERVTAQFPRLRERIHQRAGSLSGGEQQMLAVARGLMAAPRILIVDEPSLGLAPIVVEQLYELFVSLRDEGMTLLLVEQYVEIVLAVADRAYVLDKGSVALSGSARELRESPELVDTYLAGSAAGVLPV